MNRGDHSKSSAPLTFAFQPVFSLHTGSAVGIEAFARPAGTTPAEMLGRAAREGRLVDADVELAVAAVKSAAERTNGLPLHINITAPTVAQAEFGTLDPLMGALNQVGRRAREVVLEIGPPFARLPTLHMVRGMNQLTDLGFRLSIDALGRGDMPVSLLGVLPVQLLKLDRDVLERTELCDALVHFARRCQIPLAATGISTDEQLATAREHGVRIVQGDLFGEPSKLQSWVEPAVTKLKPTPPGEVELSTIGPRVLDFLRPARTLPDDATCEDVRGLLSGAESVTGLIGLDKEERPKWSIDRNRFLLAMAGPYGHALHAKRPAKRLADIPHMVNAEASALEVLEQVMDGDWQRSGDDVVVVDHDGRCLGIALVTEVVRGISQIKIDEATSLNPLTKLPGTDSIAKDVDRRISSGEPFVIAWLDVDSFKAVNDGVGFAAGDDLIKELGATLTDVSDRLDGVSVCHVGGDDFLIACSIGEIDAVVAKMMDTQWSAEGRPVTVSLASLICERESIGSYRDASRLLAPLKEEAKSISGSSWVLGRPGSSEVQRLRGNDTAGSGSRGRGHADDDHGARPQPLRVANPAAQQSAVAAPTEPASPPARGERPQRPSSQPTRQAGAQRTGAQQNTTTRRQADGGKPRVQGAPREPSQGRAGKPTPSPRPRNANGSPRQATKPANNPSTRSGTIDDIGDRGSRHDPESEKRGGTNGTLRAGSEKASPHNGNRDVHRQVNGESSRQSRPATADGATDAQRQAANGIRAGHQNANRSYPSNSSQQTNGNGNRPANGSGSANGNRAAGGNRSANGRLAANGNRTANGGRSANGSQSGNGDQTGNGDQAAARDQTAARDAAADARRSPDQRPDGGRSRQGDGRQSEPRGERRTERESDQVPDWPVTPVH